MSPYLYVTKGRCARSHSACFGGPDPPGFADPGHRRPAAPLRNVTLPQLQPYFAAASRSGISLIWKIVLVVELLGRPNGVGFELHLNFQLFNVTAILGYTVAFVTVMLAIEYLLVQPLERRTTRWRNKPV